MILPIELKIGIPVLLIVGILVALFGKNPQKYGKIVIPLMTVICIAAIIYVGPKVIPPHGLSDYLWVARLIVAIILIIFVMAIFIIKKKK